MCGKIGAARTTIAALAVPRIGGPFADDRERAGAFAPTRFVADVSRGAIDEHSCRRPDHRVDLCLGSRGVRPTTHSSVCRSVDNKICARPPENLYLHSFEMRTNTLRAWN
jgi:hypothetical protein